MHSTARLENGFLVLENAHARHEFRVSSADSPLVSPEFPPVGAPFLRVRLGHDEWKIWDATGAVAFRGAPTHTEADDAQNARASGVEIEDFAPESARESEVLGRFTLPHRHFRLIQVELRDQTDARTELVEENEWLLGPSERELSLRGNLFCFEDSLSGDGFVLLKHAPLPDSRPAPQACDLRVWRGRDIEFFDGGFWCAKIPYSGALRGRVAALRAYFEAIRPFDASRDGLFLSNTWGDRSRDAHLNPQFMAREIEAGARLGGEVVQIDDGWQKGITANSAAANGGGAWDGFWASDAAFWDVHPTRFGGDLTALANAARENAMHFGLWFAPDSSNDGANWERDADAILNLHRKYGARFFKIDALKIESERSLANFEKFFAKTLRESGGQITFDLDVTAEKRFGFLGLPEVGPLFVQNRYTDWANYYPHHTLRVLWRLARWMPPHRLRLEWLNHARNAEKYGDDPLAPRNYRPDTLFAIVMLGAPLGWFEVQNLPPSYFAEAAPLIQKWKAQREKWRGATVVPIGAAPNGVEFSGFAVCGEAENSWCDLLIFRGVTPNDSHEFALENLANWNGKTEILGGRGAVEKTENGARVTIEQTLDFVWARLGFDGG